ncbi:MAG: PH domain-containing protein [Melioribacteraceae bacterium]|nr:PH domain-containing protein [Melioribacteraceae bacterium]
MNTRIMPDRKLLVKQFMVIGSVSGLILFIGLLLQILIPLDPKVSYNQAGSIIWPIVLGVILLLWIISVPLNILWIKNLSYSIETDRIIICKGILSKIQQNIPFRAITDFQLHRSLYDRFLDIGSIRIQTAGQSQTPTGYEANLAGLLSYDDIFEKLKSKLDKLHSTTEPGNEISNLPESTIIKELLEEVKEIRKFLEVNKK